MTMAKTLSNSSAQDSLTPPPPPPPHETQTVDHQSESDTDHFAVQSLEASLAGLSMEDRHPDKRDSNRAWVAEQERRIESEIIRAIYSGRTDLLRPNSGQAITIGNHYVCVLLHDDGPDPNYRTWEWHGHLMRFDEENEYTPEHFYGHHLEQVSWYDEEDEQEEEERVAGFAFPWPFSRRT